ncbi:MAG: hypothetical protein ACYTF6_12795 [Planctomycetota bacterium]
MPKLLAVACYVLAPLAWALAVELLLRSVRRLRSGRAGRDAGAAE